MSATTVYYVLLAPVLLFTIWHMTATISPPPIPQSLHNKSIVLLIAHPDDESMFFSPAVQALTRPELGNHLKILCLSTGDSDGLGETRRKELEKAAVTLGVRQIKDVLTLDDPRFRDGMRERWEEKEVAKVLTEAFVPHQSIAKVGAESHREPQRKPAEGPKSTIDILLTFDHAGVSGHPNHISLYHGSRLFVRQIMQGYAGYTCPVTLYTLTTTNIIRKYSFVLDLLPTYIVNLCSSMLESFTTSRRAAKVKNTGRDDRLVFVSDLARYLKAREAMVRGHKSQMVWFRWGWISLGRYMVVNDLRKQHVS